MPISPDTLYATMAEAEQALRSAGFERDKQRAVWLQKDTNTRAKVQGLWGRFSIKVL